MRDFYYYDFLSFLVEREDFPETPTTKVVEIYSLKDRDEFQFIINLHLWCFNYTNQYN